jgi:predicted nicotinamide N-methyase
MLATTIIDPLLSSPTQVQRHDTDMAATFEPMALPPPPQLDSLSYSSCSDGEGGSSLYFDQRGQEDDCASPSVEQQTDHEHATQQQHEEEEEEEDITPFEKLMNRGNYLRQLRALELADEMERNATSLSRDDGEEKKEEMIMSTTTTGLEVQEDHVYTITTTTSNTATTNNSSNKVKVLEYNSYLAHQRYYDDLKHVDITYIDYGYFPHNNNSSGGKGMEEEEGGGRVVIEQRKRLGKGGLCWDAAFILGEHVISLEEEWNNRSNSSNSSKKRTPANVLELGAGTGLCGIMVGKATNSHVTITDLPELQDLMTENVRRNFGHDVKEDVGNVDDANDDVELSDEERKLITHLDGTKSKGTVKSRVLRWGNEEDYFLQEEDQQQQQQLGEQQAYDVIIGADIVASLYDPIALAQTLHALCGPTTKIYISSKSRLDKPHEEFDTEMTRLFTKVVKKVCPCSRLKTPNVFIIEAEGKRDII